MNGSHRGEAGCTHQLLNKIAQGACEAGAEFETIILARHKIIRCSGCELCHTQHALQCIYENEDDVKDIFNKMRAADILIYASPVYIFSMSGLMKTFLDRFNSTAGTGELGLTKSGLFFGPVDKDLYSKPFVILTCCGNIEDETTKSVVSYFNTFSKFLDAPIVGTLVRKSVGLLETSRIPETEKEKKLIDGVMKAYVQAGRELVQQGKITHQTEKQANQHLLGIPFLNFLMKIRLFKELAVKRARQSANTANNKG